MAARKQSRKRRDGFSYLETAMALFMLIVGFLGIYSSFDVSAQVRETANETNVAMFKLQTAMETVFSVPFDDITETLSADESIQFEKITDSLPANDFKLRDEDVTISYKDTTTDPLYFTVKIAWTSRSGVPRTEEISCARAR